ncbi:hypothetical protein [Shewanella woodyi]|uniref:hypothetical protein n=1 Tax=Shewanella woodyi TaxID=60961 RepID=UPI0012F959EA|nr:hypothetical protein [Shewanella woodyi]
MGVTHGVYYLEKHRSGRVSVFSFLCFAEKKNITTVHHKMTGKSVATILNTPEPSGCFGTQFGVLDGTDTSADMLYLLHLLNYLDGH